MRWLKYMPWQWLTGLAGAVIGYFSFYPPWWAGMLGGIVGSLSFNVGYRQVTAEVRHRKQGKHVS